MNKIAVIGTGISGMAAGYFLRNDHDVTFFERNDYAGGHTNTLLIDEDGKEIAIDSAFMVYNKITYPNFIRLLDELEVETQKTSMSFSVSHQPSGLEYSGTGFKGIFAQRRNMVNPKYYQMLLEIMRFNKISREVLDDERYRDYSLGQYVQEKNFSRDMVEKYLVPMSSAVWSMPVKAMMDFPILTLVRFFKNHGFLGVTTTYQWWTVTGGSRNYRDKILSHFQNKVHINRGIKKVVKKEDGVYLTDSKGEEHVFDKVIIAAHADQAIEMLGDQFEKEKQLLSYFPYQKNRCCLHTDEKVMPKTKRAWSSWNYRIINDDPENYVTSTIYYMNSLQKVSDKKNYFVSVNDAGEVDPSKVLWETEYDHPLFDGGSIKGQDQLPSLNEQGPVYFCGAYFKYGFHEDGLKSGIDVAEKILGRSVWS
jgi:predicted NAD/FAD-binding protein